MKNILIGFLAALAIMSMMAQITQPSVPAGAVAHFTTASCPTGWTENTSVRGRTMVGLVAGGTNAGTAGTALTDLESRPAGQHTHPITDPGHQHSQGNLAPFFNGGGGGVNYVDVIGNNGAANPLTGSNTTGISTNNPAASVAGTPSPYIQYITCTKS